MCEWVRDSGSPYQRESYLVVTGGGGAEGKMPANSCSISSLNIAPQSSNFCESSHRNCLREPKEDSIQNRKQSTYLPEGVKTLSSDLITSYINLVPKLCKVPSLASFHFPLKEPWGIAHLFHPLFCLYIIFHNKKVK